MGLCKCPKKKVTNLFCFEHKVNVCENCLVADHEKCIVKSYLQWLEDSDYNAICNICDKQLQIDDMECIRLICYDIFHLQCLNEMANRLPDTTAPAGYECPLCNKSIIPHSNVAGPLVENLKAKISKSPWFIRTLRIKSAEGDLNDGDNFEFVEKHQSDLQEQRQIEDKVGEKSSSRKGSSGRQQQQQQQRAAHNHQEDDNDHRDHSVYQMPDVDQSPNNRKNFTTNRAQELPTASVYTPSHNRTDDENKYSRKSLSSHISTLIKTYFPLSTARRSPQKAYCYFIWTLIIGIFLFIILLWFFSVLGRYSADQDPMLDPRYNPNIKIAQDQQLLRPSTDDKDGSIVRGAVNNIEAPSHGR